MNLISALEAAGMVMFAANSTYKKDLYRNTLVSTNNIIQIEDYLLKPSKLPNVSMKVNSNC